MKKKVFAIVCVLIWLILIAPIVSPYIKTLFIHDGMTDKQVFDIMDHVWDVDTRFTLVDRNSVVHFQLPLGQVFGLTLQSTLSKDLIVINHFWQAPGNIPVWLFAAAAVILYTALIVLFIALAVRVFLFFRRNMY